MHTQGASQTIRRCGCASVCACLRGTRRPPRSAGVPDARSASHVARVPVQACNMRVGYYILEGEYIYIYSGGAVGANPAETRGKWRFC